MSLTTEDFVPNTAALAKPVLAVRNRTLVTLQALTPVNITGWNASEGEIYALSIETADGAGAEVGPEHLIF